MTNALGSGLAPCRTNWREWLRFRGSAIGNTAAGRREDRQGANGFDGRATSFAHYNCEFDYDYYVSLKERRRFSQRSIIGGGFV